MTTIAPKFRQMLNKVPEITIYFWIIKILCTTVGETAADYLNATLGFGLINTTYVVGALLAILLFVQFLKKKYTPGIYWLVVVLISVFGTLITDNLSDNLGVALTTTTAVFAALLMFTFALWYWFEKTLSIHSITTTRRELFYWLTILFTFALGTAAGDLTAEKFNLGYLTALLIFAGSIALVTLVHYALKTLHKSNVQRATSNAVAAFWMAYILTRPLGASIGDYLSQAHSDGGLGLGTTITSCIFLVAILATVIYLMITKKDITPITVQS
jgi:uncharacterized membrane-anchored protein